MLSTLKLPSPENFYTLRFVFLLNVDFLRSHLLKMDLWPVEHFFPYFDCFRCVQSEEKGVQLARGAYIINNFLRNPHFKRKVMAYHI